MPLTDLDGSEEVCAICFEVHTSPVQTPCMHNFCRECLQSWGEESHTCPNCRTALYTAATIPSKRLANIAEGFYDVLMFDVVHPEDTQQELDFFNEMLRRRGEPPPLRGEREVRGDYNEIQS